MEFQCSFNYLYKNYNLIANRRQHEWFDSTRARVFMRESTHKPNPVGALTSRTSAHCTLSVNLLKPTVYVMYQ